MNGDDRSFVILETIKDDNDDKIAIKASPKQNRLQVLANELKEPLQLSEIQELS